jgi:beta-lactamase class A
MQKQTSQAVHKNFSHKTLLIVLVIILLLSVVCNVIQFSNQRQLTKKVQTNPFPLLDPARQFIKDEDVIVNVQNLRTYLNELAAAEKDIKLSIYFEVLTTGANISVNPTERIYPASLVKLPVALAAVYKVQTGTWQWHNQLVLLKEDIDSGSGDLHASSIGTRYTIEDLVKLDRLRQHRV